MKRKPKSWVNFSRLRLDRSALAPIKEKTQNFYRKPIKFIEAKPLTAFFTALVILMILIIAGSVLRKPKEEPRLTEKEPVKVDVYHIGTAPKIQTQAQIQKSGIVKIYAQTPGIVNKINYTEGQTVWRGNIIVALSTNYQGGNTATLGRQLAAKQYQNAVDSYPIQKDLIDKQRELTDKTDENSDKLRDITQKSVDETKDLVSTNEDILNTLETNITNLESSNTNGANDSLILQTKQLKAQLLGATNQARSALRNSEFAAGGDNVPARLSDLSKDIAQKQLDLQERTLNLNRDISLIQLKIAQVNEATMFPASPFEATVEKIHIRVGQTVTPGTLLATLAGTKESLTATVQLPQSIAKNVSKLDPSTIHIGDTSIDIEPTYISQEATDGQLYTITFPIPTVYADKLTDNAFVNIEIPIGLANSSKADPYVPLDAIHQTQDEAFVFVVNFGRAQSRKVTLGAVNGSYIQITSDLGDSDKIILSRNIVSGDSVQAN